MQAGIRIPQDSQWRKRGGGGTHEWKDRHFEKGYLFFVFLDAVLETSFLEEEKHSPLASTMHFSLELV